MVLAGRTFLGDVSHLANKDTVVSCLMYLHILGGLFSLMQVLSRVIAQPIIPLPFVFT